MSESENFKRSAEDIASEGAGDSSLVIESDTCKRIKTETAAESDHFERLYETAFEFIQKTMKVSEEELQDGYRTVKQSFYFDMGGRFSDVDLNKSENLCAYFRMYYRIATELSRSKILLALENCEELQSCFNRVNLNVMCVGGGPGFEMVGLCSALAESSTCQKLQITVVDKAKRWRSFLDIVVFLLREGDFGKSSDIFKKTNASVNFLGESACNENIISYSNALKEANVILMKHFLSSVLLSEKNKAIEVVTAGMQKGALILLINAPYCDLKKNNVEEIFSSFDKYSMEKFEVQRRNSYMSCDTRAQIAVFKKTNE